ncbi:hypothetical protein Bca52824_028647 [Brassica carinata]|uniref:F-box associated beta-propeller type 1 domain-containing protein n=1 Tax=Brassica carinata TaxID=52824 RepID=A0A8X7VD56_BRACI|nr:hypothetical protein Bca52824_028647 [Brassica carinata]
MASYELISKVWCSNSFQRSVACGHERFYDLPASRVSALGSKEIGLWRTPWNLYEQRRGYRTVEVMLVGHFLRRIDDRRIEVFGVGSTAEKVRYVSGGDLKLQRHGVAGFGRRVSLSISFLSDVFRRSEGEGGPMEVTATASLTLRHDVGGGTRVLPAKGEQLAVIFQRHLCDLVIWITTKIEPDAVSWSNFFKFDLKPYLGFDHWFKVRSFVIDKEKKIGVVCGTDLKSHTNEEKCYVVEEDGCYQAKTEKRYVFSYVPSSVQIQVPSSCGKRKGRDY